MNIVYDEAWRKKRIQHQESEVLKDFYEYEPDFFRNLEITHKKTGKKELAIRLEGGGLYLLNEEHTRVSGCYYFWKYITSKEVV